MTHPTDKAPLTFRDKILGMMARTGKTYHQCCRMLGGKGGKTAARNKLRRRMEREKQERMGLQ